MPTLNKAEFLAEAVNSILNQTYEDFELLVVDNGSSDSSVEIALSFAGSDSRVKLIREPRRGLSFALNAGIANCKGRYVALIGADDVYRKDKLQAQLKAIDGNSRYSICHSDAWVMDRHGNPNGKLTHRDYVRVLETELTGNLFKRLLMRDLITGGTIMLLRECWEKERFDTHLFFAEDWDMWVRLARSYEFLYIPEPLYGYRIYEGNSWGQGRERFVQSNHARAYEKWLRIFGDLEEDDRRSLIVSLSECYADLRNVSALGRLVLTNRAAMNYLSRRLRSSFLLRLERVLA